MELNGIIISEQNLAKLSSVLPEALLREEYELNGLSDAEISDKVGLSQSWVCKLRKIYEIKTDPSYQLRRNKLRFISLTERQKEFLYGSLFGDSCIAIQQSGQGYWLCRHCVQQESYLLRKAEILKESHDTAWEYISKEMIPCFSYKIPKKYRTKDNQQPSLEGNLFEGSTTEESLISTIEDGGNSYCGSVTSHGMPEANELVGCDTV